MDVPKRGAAAAPEDSRLSPLSRMLKQPRKNSGRSPAGAARKSGPEAAAPQPQPVKASTATVGATIIVKGDVTGKGDVFVSGTVEGTIDLADNRVTVEGTGRVKGSIVGRQVQVKGKVVGDIEALEKLIISSTGTVRGTIVAPRLAVEDGAKFKGRIEMDFDEGQGARAAAGPSKN